MLSQPEARRLAALLPQFLGLLSAESRIAVTRYTHTALGALNAFAAGRALDRQAVVTALVFIELEIRNLGRMAEASDANSAERERLWGEIESITGGM
jgi:hypothetical protein